MTTHAPTPPGAGARILRYTTACLLAFVSLLFFASLVYPPLLTLALVGVVAAIVVAGITAGVER